MLILGISIGMLGSFMILGDATKDLPRGVPILFHPISPTGQKIASGVSIFSLIIFFFFLACFIVMLFGVKEPSTEVAKTTNLKSFFQDLVEPFKDTNFRFFLISYFLLWTSLSYINYTIMNLLTFLLDLRGNEFALFAIVAFSAAIAAFILWSKLSEKLGLKRTTSICILITIVAFLMIVVLTIPMPHHIRLIFGFIIVSVCLVGYVGSMIFPPAIMGDIIDSAELTTGKKLTGAYSGAWMLVLSFGEGFSMLLISVFLEIFGPESSLSYALIYLFGACLLSVSYIIFQKIIIVGTEKRMIRKEE